MEDLLIQNIHIKKLFAKTSQHILKLIMLVLILCISCTITFYSSKIYSYPFNKISSILKQDHELKRNVLKFALDASTQAKNLNLGYKNILTVIDYSMPSSQKRLWVIDLKTNRVLFKTHVAHGRESGNNIPNSFSNQPKSYKSSLGLFITGKIRLGKHGKSLEVYGLEKNINSNAFKRKIVFHPATYVNDNIIKQLGRLGRSYGCFSLQKNIAYPLMHTIANGSYVYVYHPQLLKK